MTGHALKLLIVGSSVAVSIAGVVRNYRADHSPGPNYGIWDVQRFAERNPDGQYVEVEDADWLALLIERERGGRGAGWFQVPDHSLRHAGPAWNDTRTEVTLSSGASWSYREEGDTLVLQGEFQRSFRADPTKFDEPGTPRAPQIEIALGRDPAENAPNVDPNLPVGDDVAGESGDDGATTTEPFPATLVGRWVVTRTEMIGDTYTRRRTDPYGYEAVTFTGEGTAVFEFEDGRSESYAMSIAPEQGTMRFTWSSEFTVEQPVASTLVLRGEHRGRALEVELARRDLNSFLLVRRGYHWINEIPLNRH